MLQLAEAPHRRPGEIAWRDRPFQSLQSASQILGLSTASLYRMAAAGHLKLRRLSGRTLVETQGLIALIESAEEWTPSTRTRQATAAHKARGGK
jgi:hypothetical protein